MTRINVGLMISNMTDEHLIAELNEIRFIPTLYPKTFKSGSINKIPLIFTLNKGHILFFINKGGYCLRRYKLLYQECKRRGFNVQDDSDRWDKIDIKHMGDYVENIEDYLILKKRIVEKVKKSPKKNFRFYGMNISKDEVINMLKFEII